MPPTETAPSNADRETAVKLVLFVAGNSQRAITAMSDLRALCDEHRGMGWSLEVVDVLQNPARAAEAEVMVTPTLIASRPDGDRRVVGRFDDVVGVLEALEIAKS
jgi:circadian clock protein KaiB